MEIYITLLKRLFQNVIVLNRNHYAQHVQAVEAARRGKSGRLENFGPAETQNIVPAEDICGLCER